MSFNKIKKYILILAVFILCFSVFGQIVMAENYGNYGLDTTIKTKTTTGGASPEDALTSKTPSEIIGKIIGAGLAFIGILFFILMIYGGFLWMTARGNEQQVEKAKNLIISAVIGLVIVLSAYAITSYIGNVL